MDWGRPVTIPAPAVRTVSLVAAMSVTLLWFFSRLPYFVVVLLLAIGWMAARRRSRRRNAARSAALAR